MATLGELSIDVVVDADDAISGLDELSTELDDAASGFESAGGASDSFGDKLFKLDGIVSLVQTAISALGLDQLAQDAMGAAKSISGTQASLTGIYGDTKRAGDMMAYINKEFGGTRVGAEAVHGLAINLGYMGLEADSTEKIMRNVVDSVEFLGGTDANIESVSDALINAQNSGTVFNDTLNQLSANGIPIFEALGEHLGLTSGEIKELAANGELDFETLMAVMENLSGPSFDKMQAGIEEVRGTWDYQWDAMKNSTALALGEVLNEVMNSEAVGDILGSIADKASSLPEMLTKLGDVLTKYGIVDAIKDIANNFMDFLVSAAPLAKGFFIGLGGVIGGAVLALGYASEAIGWLADAFGGIQGPLTTVGTVLGGLVGLFIVISAVMKVAAIAVGVWSAAVKIWTTVTKAATVAKLLFSAALWASPITWIILGIIALIAVIVLIIMYWDQIAAVTTAVWAVIVAALQAAWDWITGLFTTAWTWLVDTVTGMWDAIATAFQEGKQWIIDAVQSAIDWIMDIFYTWHPVGIIISHWDSIVAAFRAGKDWAINLVMELVDRVLGFLRTLGQLPAMVGGFFRDMYNRARGQVQTLLSFVRGIPGQIRGFFSNAGNILVNAGKNIVKGLIRGVQNMIGGLRNKFSEITGMIPDWKGPEAVDLKLLEPAGEDIMDGLMNGIEDRTSDLRSTLGGITSDIPGMVNANVSGRYAGATKVIIDVDGADGEFKRMIRKMVRTEGGGDVQSMFGQ